MAHDSLDFDLLSEVFTETDEPLRFPSFNIANLRLALPPYFEVAGPTILFVCNHLIDVDVTAGEGSGQVYCMAKLDIAGEWVDQAIPDQDS